MGQVNKTMRIELGSIFIEVYFSFRFIWISHTLVSHLLQLAESSPHRPYAPPLGLIRGPRICHCYLRRSQILRPFADIDTKLPHWQLNVFIWTDSGLDLFGFIWTGSELTEWIEFESPKWVLFSWLRQRTILKNFTCKYSYTCTSVPQLPVQESSKFANSKLVN